MYRLFFKRIIAARRLAKSTDAAETSKPVTRAPSLVTAFESQYFLGEPSLVIGLEAADYQAPWYDTSWLNRPDVHGGEVCAALAINFSSAKWENPPEHPGEAEASQDPRGWLGNERGFQGSDQEQ